MFPLKPSLRQRYHEQGFKNYFPGISSRAKGIRLFRKNYYPWLAAIKLNRTCTSWRAVCFRSEHYLNAFSFKFHFGINLRLYFVQGFRAAATFYHILYKKQEQALFISNYYLKRLCNSFHYSKPHQSTKIHVRCI